MGKPNDLVQGTLDLLILKILSLEPKHGWAIAQRIQQISHETLQVQQGSLYPALLRMKRAGWIKSEWRQTENNRRARYYLLTTAGRRQLGTETAAWEKASEAVNAFLRTTTLEDNR